MRIRDWSADVYSSDLRRPRRTGRRHSRATRARRHGDRLRRADPRPGQGADPRRRTAAPRQARTARPRPAARAVRTDEGADRASRTRSEEHTSELQSLMRISYAVFCLKKKTYMTGNKNTTSHTIQ